MGGLAKPFYNGFHLEVFCKTTLSSDFVLGGWFHEMAPLWAGLPLGVVSLNHPLRDGFTFGVSFQEELSFRVELSETTGYFRDILLFPSFLKSKW